MGNPNQSPIRFCFFFPLSVHSMFLYFTGRFSGQRWPRNFILPCDQVLMMTRSADHSPANCVQLQLHLKDPLLDDEGRPRTINVDDSAEQARLIIQTLTAHQHTRAHKAARVRAVPAWGSRPPPRKRTIDPTRK
jgi:hypothetical protein